MFEAAATQTCGGMPLSLHGKSDRGRPLLLHCSQSRLSFMHHQALEMLNASWNTGSESRRISA